jgi:hypothetical protein
VSEVLLYTRERAKSPALSDDITAALDAAAAASRPARRAAARARALAKWDETPEDAAWYAEQAILTHEECRVRAIGPTHLDRRAGKRKALVYGNKIKTGKYVRTESYTAADGSHVRSRRIPVLQQVRKTPHVKRT